MLDDSSLDLLGHIEQKILLLNPNDFQNNRQMTAKRDLVNQTFNKIQKTKSLNPPEFYEKHQLKDKWIRLD
jgi:hypothetical protein